jgi:hypothetical protein
VITALPDWALPVTPHRNAIFEVAALANIEGQWVQLSADQQRCLLGHPVFGKQSIRIHGNGLVDVVRKTCFGSDSELATYDTNTIHEAAHLGKRLSPGVHGPGFFTRSAS